MMTNVCVQHAGMNLAGSQQTCSVSSEDSPSADGGSGATTHGRKFQ